jgi:hypothetical protein
MVAFSMAHEDPASQQQGSLTIGTPHRLPMTVQQFVAVGSQKWMYEVAEPGREATTTPSQKISKESKASPVVQSSCI